MRFFFDFSVVLSDCQQDSKTNRQYAHLSNDDLKEAYNYSHGETVSRFDGLTVSPWCVESICREGGILRQIPFLLSQQLGGVRMSNCISNSLGRHNSNKLIVMNGAASSAFSKSPPMNNPVDYQKIVESLDSKGRESSIKREPKPRSGDLQ